MLQPARNVVGLAPPVPARGSVRAFPPPGPPAVKAELMEGFTRARFEGDPAVKAEWGSVARWTMAMPRRVREQLPHVEGDFKAIGLVEGYPVYERTSKDGVGAMIGLDTNECLDSSSCLLYVCCV